MTTPITDALLCAKLSRWAYERPEVVRNLAGLEGLDRVEFIENGGTQAFVCGGKELVVVAFRGTDEPEDLITDLGATLRRYDRGSVHKGFANALFAVWRKVYFAVESFADADQRVICTGHSLGAALATLMFPGLGADQLVTFGSPRVGDVTFARWFNKKFAGRAVRYVNNNDVVTRLPMVLMGYRHVGRLAYITARGRIKSGATLWFRLKDAAFGLRADLFSLGLDGLKDHSMDEYLRLVEANL